MKTKNNLAIPTIIAVTVAVSILVALSATASAAVINVPEDQPTIQAAVTAATYGDTINVAAGTYYEVGQIVINTDLAIVGAGKDATIIKPDHDTTVSGYVQSDAWIYVPSGVTFALSGVTLDGTDLGGAPQIIRHAIQSRGELTVEDCSIMNIKATDASYDGRGIVLLAGTTNTIARCEFSDIQRIGIHVRGGVVTNPIAYIEDCTYVGKGDGDWLDYGIEFGGGGSGTVDGCDISACTGVAAVDGSTSAGIYATDYYATGTSATVVNSGLTGNSVGIRVGYKLEFDDATVLTAHCNDISGNTVYGIRNVGTEEVNAENNWWGDVSGPNGVGLGIGDAVSVNVDFDPWIGITELIPVLDGPTEPVQINALVSVDYSFTCNSGTATLDWGDENSVPLEVNSGSVDYTYPDAGVYTVKLTIEDCCGCGTSYSRVFRYVVVYDPSAGFVTGGGWINSPERAYTAQPTLTGKANFGFVSKYKKGQTTPTGNTEFQFKAGDLNFHSDSYDWLVIAGHKAMYKGTGTINGDGNFGFMLSAIDEKLTPSTDVDGFRIKIWDKDAGDEVVYDNQMGDVEDAEPTTAIAGGQIVIHKAK